MGLTKTMKINQYRTFEFQPGIEVNEHRSYIKLIKLGVFAALATLGSTSIAETASAQSLPANTTTIPIVNGTTEYGAAYNIANGFGDISRTKAILAFIEANNSYSPNALPIGGQLIVPVYGNTEVPIGNTGTPEHGPGGTTLITIEAGFTDWSIAHNIAVSGGQPGQTSAIVGQIEADNPGVNPNTLKIGSQEVVPVSLNSQQ